MNASLAQPSRPAVTVGLFIPVTILVYLAVKPVFGTGPDLLSFAEAFGATGIVVGIALGIQYLGPRSESPRRFLWTAAIVALLMLIGASVEREPSAQERRTLDSVRTR
jgi:hypothetical protein